ncbi:alpha/beta hydrolase [Rhodococcus sp. X156]|uniref:alpha/beta fold hydrolase n=1 Tax=Rhodococcus sp. X156 TaxID=2499145 RepID=UPI000FD91C78|nr:alpha/beta hydrolase [Rhodococcus sp. X156]
MSGWRRAGLASGAVGVAAAATVHLEAVRRLGASPYTVDGFGLLPVDRVSTVAADDGVPLRVEETGSPDAPLTVVFVHGFCLNMGSWYFQRRDLPQRTDARLVFYDQRSHGRSGTSDAENCTIDQLGRDLQAVLRTVAPTGPVVLVGHSMGGMTIMALARQRPELFDSQIAGVAFIATAANGMAPSRMSLSARNPLIGALRWAGNLGPDLVQRGRPPVNVLLAPIVRAMSYGDRTTSRTVVEFTERMIASTPAKTVFDFLPTLADHDELDALGAVAGRPIIVLCGDADRLTPYRHTAVIGKALADARLTRVPGAGHLLQLERATLVNGAVLDLITEVRGPRRRRTAARA